MNVRSEGKECAALQACHDSGQLHPQGQYDVLRPKRTTLAARVPPADEACIEFLSTLLTVDPSLRPTAAQALQHPWLAEQHA